jgi:hypothetical protein
MAFQCCLSSVPVNTYCPRCMCEQSGTVKAGRATWKLGPKAAQTKRVKGQQQIRKEGISRVNRESHISHLPLDACSEVISPQAFLGGVRFGGVNGRGRSMPRPGPAAPLRPQDPTGGLSPLRAIPVHTLRILYISPTCAATYSGCLESLSSP